MPCSGRGGGWTPTAQRRAEARPGAVGPGPKMHTDAMREGYSMH